MIYFIASGKVELSLDVNSVRGATTRTIDILEEGSYFGELALLTNLKRTLNAKSLNFSTLAYMTREIVEEASKEFPQILLNLKKNMLKYNDTEMKFRMQMIENVYYF